MRMNMDKYIITLVAFFICLRLSAEVHYIPEKTINRDMRIWHNMGRFKSDTLGQQVLVVDTIQIPNPLVLKDKKSGIEFVKNIPVNDVKPFSKASTQKLLSDGWAIWCAYLSTPFMEMISNKMVTRMMFDHSWHYTDIPDDGIYYPSPDNFPADIRLKKYDVFHVKYRPSCYLLILITGKQFNMLGSSDNPIRFKDDKAYYPLIIPMIHYNLLNNPKIVE